MSFYSGLQRLLGPPRKPQEDSALVQGPQGLHPINADIANFRGGQLQPFGRGPEDEYTPAAALERTGYINPQVTQHMAYRQGGYPQLQAQPNPLDALRRLLGL